MPLHFDEGGAVHEEIVHESLRPEGAKRPLKNLKQLRGEKK